MKRIITLILAVIMLMSFCVTALGAEYTGEVEPINVLLMNADTGDVLYSKNENEAAYSAGLVKLMTAYVTVKSIDDLDTVVTVSSSSFSTLKANDDITLYPRLAGGEQITVRDLLGGMLVASGNDCALALANYVGGSVSNFVKYMNNYAAELGMSGTNYTNPTGKHYSYQYTTAADVAKLVNAILSCPELMEIVSCVSYTIPETNKTSERTFYNTNRLICAYSDEEDYVYPDATGMIAGYTSNAAACLAASAERYGTKLICVILGDISKSRTVRWTLAADLFDFGFEQYAPTPAADILSDIPLTYTDANGAEYEVEPDFTDVMIKFGTMTDGITAAVSSEDGTSGTAVYTNSEGTVVAEVPVTLTEIVPEVEEEPEIIPDEPEIIDPVEIPEEPEEEEKDKLDLGKFPFLAILLTIVVLAVAFFGSLLIGKKKSSGRHNSERDSFKVKFRQNFMTYLLFACIALILIIVIWSTLA